VLTIFLPGPPRGKGRPRFGKGRTYTDAKTVDYETRLAFAAQQEIGPRWAPLTGPLRVTVTACFEVPKSWTKGRRCSACSGGERPTGKPDADNVLKMLDALNGVVWVDDAQIVSATIHKVYEQRVNDVGLTITVETL
jgi:Holliday junction resolvase RusA-like endonuclease